MPALRTTSASFITIPPGETIKERLSALRMTTSDLAHQWHCSENEIQQLLIGDQPITAEIAHQLENTLNVPASFWRNLEAIYRDTLRKIQMESAVP